MPSPTLTAASPGEFRAPAAEQSAPISALTYDSTVSRAMVHRRAVAEVFVTDAAPEPDGRYAVAAQFPRGHSFFNDGPGGYHDLMMVAEAVRQAGVYIAHAYFGLPADRPFIFGRLDLAADGLAAVLAGPRPSQARILADPVPTGPQGRAMRGLDFTGTVQIDDAADTIGGGASLLFMSPRGYQAFRERARQGALAGGEQSTPPERLRAAVSPCPPALVGRTNEANVVVGNLVARDERTVSTAVLVDVNHPVLFDHPLDHVPGMLLLEAARQGAVVAASRLAGLAPAKAVVTACRASFTTFTELDLALSLTVRIESPTAAAPAAAGSQGSPLLARAEFVQAGKPVAKVEVEVTRCP
ncbi:MAG: ScbA/BarX family gamma-butyrolactone biosynthesis protein [Actinocrinis sp.]